jgi:hypothetical protein
MRLSPFLPFLLLKTPLTQHGVTKNPCGALPGLTLLDSQTGPYDGVVTISPDKISLIVDGSPDEHAVAAFDTLYGNSVAPAQPLFWENIGAQANFKASEDPSGSVVYQNYPAYNVYSNGGYIQMRSHDETADPSLTFLPNPYLFGTVPCGPAVVQGLGIFITPGGRCGDAHSSPDSTVRQPFPPYVVH